MAVSGVKTSAFVVHAAKDDFRLEDVTLDGSLKHDELLVEMKYSGICHTDLIVQQGDVLLCEYPAIFGHEGAGTIKAIGSKVKNEDLRVGDFVLLSINFCDQCRLCKTGHPTDCTEGTRLHFFGVRDDGSTAATLTGTNRSVRAHFFGQSSFANYSYVHETCVVKHPAGPDGTAIYAPMGCGYQTGAGTVLNILKPSPDSSVAIFGLGTVGLTALMAAKYLGVRQIIAIDIVESKFPIALELGATDIVNSKGIDIVAKVKELTHYGADYAIDCTGVPAVIETMLKCLAMRGTAAGVGVPPSGSTIQVDPLAYLLGSKRYIGCREGDSVPTVFIPELVEMHRRGQFPVDKLCKVYHYTQFSQALSDLHDGKVVKPIIQWS